MKNNHTQTLQEVLDHHLGFPKIIRRADGKKMVRTSKSLILNGEVQVNDMRVMDPGHEVRSGDYVKWGMIRYGQKKGITVR